MAAASEDYGDEYDEYYDDEEEQGPSGLLILVVIALIILVFSLIVMFAYQRGIADGEKKVPLVTAEAGPVKTERAIDPPAGGSRSEVDAALSGNPPAEMLQDFEDDGEMEQTLSAADQVTRDQADPEPVTTTPPREAEPAPAETKPAETQPTATQPTRPEPKQPEPKQEEPARRPAATVASAISGSHLVQVGAFGSDEEANTFYSRMQDRYSSLMSGKASDIQRADLGDKGVYHRLRIGPFASSAEASDWCGKLKAAGQDCLVRAVD